MVRNIFLRAGLVGLFEVEESALRRGYVAVALLIVVVGYVGFRYYRGDDLARCWIRLRSQIEQRSYIGNLRARWVDIVKVYVLPFSGSVKWLNDDVVVGNRHGVMVLADPDPWLWMVLLVGASLGIQSKA